MSEFDEEAAAADEETSPDDIDPRARLQTTHRKEAKALQAEIQRLKKAVPKGDNKRKKAVQAEIEALEQAMERRHADELRDLKASLDAFSLSESKGTESASGADDDKKKPSKAQKLREKKEQEELERQQRIKDGEVRKGESAQEIETAALTAILLAENLQIEQVTPNGHCLFQAICNQVGAPWTVAGLRREVVMYMRANADDFLPFLSTDAGNPMTPDDFDVYLKSMETTAAWGGQCEIRALASVLHRTITVYQADAPAMVIGEDHSSPIIRLTYHRRQYALGEHYNSAVAHVASLALDSAE